MEILYNSTRDDKVSVTASQAILKGLADDGGLFVRGGVLVENTLRGGLVDRLDGLAHSGVGGGLVAGLGGGVELLDVGLQLRLDHLVLHILLLGDENALLCGLNVSQSFPSS